MKKLIIVFRRNAKLFLTMLLVISNLMAQTNPKSPIDDDIVRITTELVQIDVVVLDKNKQPVDDLKIEDFQLEEKGRKQEIKFLEYVNSETGASKKDGNFTDKTNSVLGLEPTLKNISTPNLKRAIAFVVDDLTIPVEDLIRARQMLKNFIDNEMKEGDLVAIVRTISGSDLTQQFTSDKQMLRRAIDKLNYRSNPYSAFNNPQDLKLNIPQPVTDTNDPNTATEVVIDPNLGREDTIDDVKRTSRAFMSLVVANSVIDSMRTIPGRKNLILISGGIPTFQIGQGGNLIASVKDVFANLADNAMRSGVVINTMDIQGLKTIAPKFSDTPGKSSLGPQERTIDVNNPFDRPFGFGIDSNLLGDSPFGLEGQLGLRGLANVTGGVSVVNSNNFNDGLDKILERNKAYYRLAYTPTEKFDGKYHKIEIKVKREGVNIYSPSGYAAREIGLPVPKTKEEEILLVARSPLTKKDLGIDANFLFTFLPDNKLNLDIHLLIDAKKLSFKESENTHQSSLDVVGFVVDSLGRTKGGFSQTINSNLTNESYNKALSNGLSYSASTQLPQGVYQLILVVRENGTGRIGSLTKYLEVPDVTNKKLITSSIFLYAVDPKAKPNDAPEQMLAPNQISRRKDLRYATAIYNAKTENNKTEVVSTLIISQQGKILFIEPEQPATKKEDSSLYKWGQVVLSKVQPGKYLLTLIITDKLADKNSNKVIRNTEFIVVE